MNFYDFICAKQEIEYGHHQGGRGEAEQCLADPITASISIEIIIKNFQDYLFFLKNIYLVFPTIKHLLFKVLQCGLRFIKLDSLDYCYFQTHMRSDMREAQFNKYDRVNFFKI